MSSSADTSNRIVTSDSELSASFRLNQWLAAYLSFFLVGAILVLTLIKVPYYTLHPGSVRGTEALIIVEEAETYPARGSINYTTVSLRRSTLLQLLSAELDPDVEITTQTEVLGDRDRNENRRLNLAMMDNSQQMAARVALEELGYEVPISATGETVLEVEEDFPAAGVLHEGDTIVGVGDERIDDPGDLQRLMSGKGPGDEVSLLVERFGETEEEEVALTLAADPEDPERGLMGVVVEATGVEFDFPIDISFDTGPVGGPSAGLALALGLIDILTPGELTGGSSVAVTGTIAMDGSVGQIGGVGQKAAAARRDGVDVFLVPTADYEDARAHAGDVEIVKVDSLDEALAALAELGGNGLALPSLGDGAEAAADSG